MACFWVWVVVNRWASVRSLLSLTELSFMILVYGGLMNSLHFICKTFEAGWRIWQTVWHGTMDGLKDILVDNIVYFYYWQDFWWGNAPFCHLFPNLYGSLCNMMTYNLALFTQQGTMESGGFRLQTQRQTGRLHSFATTSFCWLTGLLDLCNSWQDCQRSGIMLDL